MGKGFSEYKPLNLSDINKEILLYWEENNTFGESLKSREGAETFVFYEGPPSANGIPGIHHVMSRTIKDAFCRYKTMKGFHVLRLDDFPTKELVQEVDKLIDRPAAFEDWTEDNYRIGAQFYDFEKLRHGLEDLIDQLRARLSIQRSGQ